jgi:hypothetical protein
VGFRWNQRRLGRDGFLFDDIGKAGDTEPAAILQVFNVNSPGTVDNPQGAWAIARRDYRRGEGRRVVATDWSMTKGRGGHSGNPLGHNWPPVSSVFDGIKEEGKT